MNYGAFEYIFGTHHTASTQWVGHNSLFVGLSDVISEYLDEFTKCQTRSYHLNFEVTLIRMMVAMEMELIL